MEKVVLVDSRDQEVGQMEKIEAHEKGLLHRAFSVLLFNEKKELLIQKRASSKYHSSGLWSNTCCSHPRPNEQLNHAVERRLMEELGVAANTQSLYSFIYKIEFDNNLVEHELDHVFIGETNSTPSINPSEVEDWKWISWKDLKEDISKNSNNYTFWFKQIISYLDNNLLSLPEKYRPI